MNENMKRSEISDDLLQKAEKAHAALLPTKSEPKYKKEYDKFLQWLKVNRIENKNISETSIMLAYFQDMSESYSPNSLWTKWSMLKSMMTIYNTTDGSRFYELEAFLKRKSKGYKPKKSKVFSRDDVKFLKSASDEEYLLHKVVLIMGYFGGCRGQELLNMKINQF